MSSGYGGGSSKYGGSKGGTSYGGGKTGGYGGGKTGGYGGAKSGYGGSGLGGKSTGMGGGMGGFVNTPSAITDDYTFCDTCGRKYNEQAYTRHIPTCERRAKDALMKNKLKGTSSGSTGFTSNTNILSRKK
jgi:hypothetical protein